MGSSPGVEVVEVAVCLLGVLLFRPRTLAQSGERPGVDGTDEATVEGEFGGGDNSTRGGVRSSKSICRGLGSRGRSARAADLRTTFLGGVTIGDTLGVLSWRLLLLELSGRACSTGRLLRVLRLGLVLLLFVVLPLVLDSSSRSSCHPTRSKVGTAGNRLSPDT